ncbi:MAG TPA: hydroxyphenylacetyl-CoA thioesterase PaaI [Rhodoblastus sp.]|nr:hydroxyphenylacetyl-CoA thioesterase PaaI [Rhodoblastus sp.]
MTPEEIARASADRMWEFDAVSAATGMELTSVGPGAATVEMRVRPDMLNAHKICHGGHIFTLADTAFAYACNSYGVSTVAQHCSISFLAPARPGDLLIAHAREVHVSGRSGVYDVSVVTRNGEPIAEFRGLSRAVPKAPIGGAS